MKNQPFKYILSALRINFVVAIACFANSHNINAQVVSLNGVYISTTPGTVVTSDTIRVNSSSTLANNGTHNHSNIINDGAILGSGTYNVTNLFSNTGSFTANTSTVNFNGSGNQTLPGLTYYNITVSEGNTKSAGGTINIINELSVGTNTTLALGSHNIRLKSDSTYTASVTAFPSSASITYGSGKFIAERYVKGRRKYRLVTSPVTTSPNATLSAGEEASSIWGNWQNQGNNSTPNTGTFITGGSAASGFDAQTTNASLFTYDAAGRIFTGFTSANGKNTKYTPLKAGVPYYMFVYGDRTNTAYTSNPNKTVLSAAGTLLTGDQTYTTSSTIPLNATTNGYTMLGNPYASSIDWASISRTNIADTYWGWDPNLNSTGGYVTVNTAGSVTLIAPYAGSVGLTQHIQSGQGFFVKTTGASPTMTIHESDKVSNFNGLAFRTEVNSLPLIAINLLYEDANGSNLVDGVLAAFDTGFSNTIGNEDASKITSTNEVLAIKLNNELLSINARKIPAEGDTIQFHTAALNKSSYRLQVFTNQLDNSTLEPWLVDSYLNTSRLLSVTDTSYINFTVDQALAASAKPNRFYIVFKQPGQLSPMISSVSASKVSGSIKVDWSVSGEAGVNRYEVEKAESGSAFRSIGNQQANGSFNYQLIDNNAVPGINQYRIRIVHSDGSLTYSRTVSVNMGEIVPAIKVFPNPVVNRQIQVRLFQLEQGIYKACLFNAKGQLILQQDLVHEGGISSAWIPVNSTVAAGVYYLRLANAKNIFNQTVIIQ